MNDQSLMRGYVVGPGQGLPHRVQHVKASGRSTGGSLTVMELSVDDGPPRHIHTREDESVYLFTGTLEVECGGDRFRAEPGSFVFLPRGLPHAFRSVGRSATGLLIITPGGLDEYFAELHEANPADATEIKKIQETYGIERS